MRSSKSGCAAHVVARGAEAGLAGTLVITLIARIIPWLQSAKSSTHAHRKLPSDLFEPEKVKEWQDRSRSPAAYRSLETNEGGTERTSVEEATAVTPAGALSEVSTPGPEGAAELFVVKVGSGLFDRDVSEYARPAGKLLHLACGTLGGVLYSLSGQKETCHAWKYGAGYGLLIWGLGPAWLVPAMHLTPAPNRMKKGEMALTLGGHLIYGVTVAKVFASLVRGRK